jgi:prevent-host-death family protein
MRISVTEAKGRLTDLARRAEAGDEIILTRRGQSAVQIVAVKSTRQALHCGSVQPSKPSTFPPPGGCP